MKDGNYTGKIIAASPDGDSAMTLDELTILISGVSIGFSIASIVFVLAAARSNR